MTDIALIWSDNAADIAAAAYDLQTDDGLETALILSLFSDRRVGADEELPLGVDSRRGFWADSLAEVQGDKFGSRLWLLNREKIVPEVVAKAREYATEAVQWLIDDKVAARVDVTAEKHPTRFGELDIQVVVYRPTGQQAKYRFNYNWQAQAAKTV